MRQWLDPGPKHSPQLPWQERQVAFDEENSDDLDNRRNVAQCYFLTWFGKKLNWKNQASYCLVECGNKGRDNHHRFSFRCLETCRW